MNYITDCPLMQGSIFVTYKSVEECKKVKESESKKFKEDDEEDLIIKFQKEHQARAASPF